MNFHPEQKYSKNACLNDEVGQEQIVEIMIHSSMENFQPGIPIAIGTNSEQEVDEMHVSTYCHAMLCDFFFLRLNWDYFFDCLVSLFNVLFKPIELVKEASLSKNVF